MFIAFHGTTAAIAAEISVSGFRPETWFAYHLENALAFGGDHVFEVAFEGLGEQADPRHPDHRWQWFVEEPVGPQNIVSLTSYEARTLFTNEALRTRIFESNLARRR
jgi:hypothetical protein